MNDLHDWLRAQLDRIPLTRAMQVGLVAVDTARVQLEAPLAPNINDKQSAFGGSIATLLTLSGWCLLSATLQRGGMAGGVYVQDCTLDYRQPGLGALTAIAEAEADVLDRFLRQYALRGRARAELRCQLTSAGRDCAGMQARFVALPA